MTLIRSWWQARSPETKVLILLCLFAALAWTVLGVMTFLPIEAQKALSTCEALATSPGLEAVESDTGCQVTDGSRVLYTAR